MRWEWVRAGTGSPVSRLFVPITMATLRSGPAAVPRAVCPAAGSHVGSAVHVPPSPCAPLHGAAAFRHSPDATKALSQPGDSSLPGACCVTATGSPPGSASGSVEERCPAPRGLPEAPARGCGRADLTLGGSATPAQPRPLKAELPAAGFHARGTYSPEAHGAVRHPRKALFPEHWHSETGSAPAQQQSSSSASPTDRGLQLHIPAYLNLVLPTLLLSYFPGQRLLLGSELLDVQLSSAAFSL